MANETFQGSVSQRRLMGQILCYQMYGKIADKLKEETMVKTWSDILWDEKTKNDVSVCVVLGMTGTDWIDDDEYDAIMEALLAEKIFDNVEGDYSDFVWGDENDDITDELY